MRKLIGAYVIMTVFLLTGCASMGEYEPVKPTILYPGDYRISRDFQIEGEIFTITFDLYKTAKFVKNREYIYQLKQNKGGSWSIDENFEPWSEGTERIRIDLRDKRITVDYPGRGRLDDNFTDGTLLCMRFWDGIADIPEDTYDPCRSEFFPVNVAESILTNYGAAIITGGFFCLTGSCTSFHADFEPSKVATLVRDLKLVSISEEKERQAIIARAEREDQARIARAKAEKSLRDKINEEEQAGILSSAAILQRKIAEIKNQREIEAKIVAEKKRAAEEKKVAEIKRAAEERMAAETYQTELITAIETILGNIGYEIGNVDGEMDLITQTAIKAYQEDKNLQANGKASENLLVSLQRSVISNKSRIDYSQLQLAGSASSMVLNEEHLLATNYHVVEDCDYLTAGNNNAKASIVKSDFDNDLSLLKANLSDTNISPLKLSGIDPELGEAIFVAGYPYNIIMEGLNFTSGHVSSEVGFGQNVSEFQHTAPMQPGNSGGPILNEYGSAVGLAVSGVDAAKILEESGSIPQNMNFGIKQSILAKLLDQAGSDYTEGRAIYFFSDEKKVANMAKAGTLLIKCWREK